MHFERLTSADDPRFSAAMEGYAVSFPPHEQREPASQRTIMTDPTYRFNLIYDGGAPVGAMLCWETETFIYVEHFFILPHLRGHACGSRALALLGGARQDRHPRDRPAGRRRLPPPQGLL